MHFVTFTPPSTEVARTVLSDQDGAKTLKNIMKQEWTEMHKGLCAASLPKLPPANFRLKLCFHAGFCICGRSQIRLRATVQQFQATMRRMLVKDSYTRHLYDQAMLVVLIHGPDGPTDSPFWFHVSFAQLRTYHMVMIPLQPVTRGAISQAAAAEGTIALQVGLGHLCNARNLWELFGSMELTQQWCSTPFAVIADNKMPVGEFLPTHVYVREVPGQLASRFWSGNLPRKRRHPQDPDEDPLPPHDLPPLADGWPGDEDDMAPPGEDDLHDAMPADLLEAAEDLEQYESEGEEAAQEEGPAQQPEVPAHDEEVQAKASDPWSVEEEDPQPELAEQLAHDGPDHEAPSDDPHNNGHAGNPGHAAGGIEVVAPAGGGHAGGPGRGPAFRRWQTPWGELVHHAAKGSMAAHCPCNGHLRCRLNSVLTKQPLGLLIYWLQKQTLYLDQPSHRDGRGECALDYAGRQDARNWLESQQGEDWDRLRALEGGPGVQEPAHVQ